MDKINLYFAFLKELEKRIPQKNTLVNKLTELLIMEKESVYRRLRKEVPFTLNETGKIARELNISLDELLEETNSESINHISEEKNLVWKSFCEDTWPGNEKIPRFCELLEIINEDPVTEAGFVMNSLNSVYFTKYNTLATFILFKWICRYTKQQHLHFEDVQIDSYNQKMRQRAIFNIEKIKSRSYIWDPNIFSNFIYDIKYYQSTHLIENESVEIMKKELCMLLDDFRKSATQGKYLDTEKNFELYIADVSVGQSFHYFGNPNYFLSVLIAFEAQTCLSISYKNYMSLETWFKRLKALSTQISVSGEKDRIRFFETQRSMIQSF